jgi:hypothetical protein
VSVKSKFIPLSAALLSLTFFFSGCAKTENQVGVRSSGKVACDSSAKSSIQNLINIQAQEFRVGNVSGAYQYFSSSFQKDIDKERFSVLAAENYQALLNSTAISYGECRKLEFGFAQAVTVTSGAGNVKFLYFVTEADGPIRVEGITIEN